MPNYGDVALQLPADWSRKANLGRDSRLVQMMVGHENGEADAYLTKEPEAEHQFTWLTIKYDDHVSSMMSQGYELVHKDTWTKNPFLWRWNSEGNCEFLGQLLAARPAHLWREEQARLKQEERDPGARFNEKLTEEAERAGALLRDRDGTPLKKTARG